jgi:hypothetical protein
MLLARGKPGDHDVALDLLRQALATAEPLGHAALTEGTTVDAYRPGRGISAGLASRYPAVALM